MKVKFIGESDPLALLHGKEYEVLAVEKGWYRIIDETGSEDGEEYPGYLYPPEAFELTEE